MALSVCVVVALPERVWQASVALSDGATVAQALACSGFSQAFPELSGETLSVAIYGQACSLDRVLLDLDRIEVTRPLRYDPMESRRRRAAHRQKARAGKT